MKKSFILAAAVALLCSCGAKQVEPEKKDIGLQLYSVRELIGNDDLYAQNHKEVFSRLSDMGYTSVEACWYNDGKFFGLTPEEFKSDLADAGLRAVSTHTSQNLTDEEVASGDFSAHMDWWKQCIADHKALGCSYIVVPSYRIPETLAGIKVYCDYFNAIGKLCAENGMKFGYHNHSGEFNKVEDQVIYDYMLQNTDPQNVFFEMDVYWAVMGKAQPVEYFKKYPGRFTMLHIKDWREVGQSGMVGFDAIFKNADKAGMKNYIVEMEGSSLGDIMETCRVSADYLKAADFVKASYAE